MRKHGRGMATIMFGFGYGEGFPDHSLASIEVEEDGEIIIWTAAADVGQGVATVVTQIAAEVLRTDPGMFRVCQGDTHLTQNAGSTSATRQTFFTGNAVKAAAEDLLGKIYHYGSQVLGSNHPGLQVNQGRVSLLDEPGRGITFSELAARLAKRGVALRGEGSFFPVTDAPDPETGQGDKIYVAYTYMTQIVDLVVDTDTGLIEVLKVNTALDLGKAINPQGVEGQIEGGTVMGIGMALLEEQVIKDGVTLNPNLTDYLVPTSMDIPEFASRLIEMEDSDGPFGAKGVGEPCTMAAAPAIANAVYDAIGVRFCQLPITPSRVLAAMAEQEDIGK
ncbi:MAG: molybdopterin cofactor-binding domain-containing protein [Halanaerobium sp.]|nr:molybdopterin cofactor-binding domain-containing protein [Halanaerobium sp.]